MYRYRTILKEACIEQVIEKSRFIAHAMPVETKEEADAFFACTRSLHRNATHNVPAFVIGEKSELQWASDDGEPQGTAGAPMLQMIIKEGITNTAVMVTRYFGGIKLGTGGLVRAYTGAAKSALAAAGICTVHELSALTARLDYPFHAKILNLAENGSFGIRETTFDDKVNLVLTAEPERIPVIRNMLADLTAGQYQELEFRQELVKKTELPVDIP